MDDKELSGAEEEKEVEKALLKPLLSLEDLVRFSTLEGSGGDSLRTLLQRGQETGAEWPGLEHANIGPYIQKMIAAAAPFKGEQDTRFLFPFLPSFLLRFDSFNEMKGKDGNEKWNEGEERIAKRNLGYFRPRQTVGGGGVGRDESRKVYYRDGGSSEIDRSQVVVDGSPTLFSLSQWELGGSGDLKRLL